MRIRSGRGACRGFGYFAVSRLDDLIRKAAQQEHVPYRERQDSWADRSSVTIVLPKHSRAPGKEVPWKSALAVIITALATWLTQYLATH